MAKKSAKQETSKKTQRKGRRVDPTTQIPTCNQAAILLLASQKKGTNDGEVHRLSGKDEMGCNFMLRSMLDGVYRQRQWKGGKSAPFVNRHGRGWLERTPVKVYPEGRRKKLPSGKRYHIPKQRILWKYTITESGKAALGRYLEWRERYMAAQEVTEISCRHSMGELAEAVRGWDTINGWGLEDCALAAIAIWADCSSAGGTDGILDGWKNVKRGRDLRFPGWGPCKGFDKHVLKRLKLPRLLPTVRSIQLQMYGVDSSSSTVTRIQDEFGPEIQQWLIRWKDWWLADNNLMRLDEIGMCLVRDIPLMIGNPERVFAELDRQVLEEEEREDAGYTALPYAAKEVGVATPAGMLSTVTDDKALTQLGKDLHNCVGGYGEFCREEGRLIAVLTDDSGKAIACGEWSHGRWGQIVGSCNQLPTKVIRVAFDAHGRQLAMLAFNKNGESPDVMRLEGQVTNDQA